MRQLRHPSPAVTPSLPDISRPGADSGLMRKFAAVLFCVAACGDNGIVVPGDEEGVPVDTDPSWGEGATPHLAPELCAARAWPSVKFDKTDVDLSFTETPDGVAMFMVDRTGGELRGFVANQFGELSTKDTGTTIRPEKISAVSAAYLDERLVVASVADGGNVFVDVVRRDLGQIANLSTAHGTMIADLPIAKVRDERFAMVADENDGITGIRFDDKWRTSSTQQLSTKAPLSITAARYLDDTIVAWSTSSTCHMTRVAAERTSSRDFACVGARLAVDPAKRAGFMVYATGDDVMISDLRIGGESELANTRRLVEKGSAPKIVFDGERFWVSYVNTRNDVVIGYLDKQGSLVSMAVEGTRPKADAYDLSIIDGEVWMYAVDEAGLGAQRFCLKPV
jgi:hypothetical protein